MLLGSVFMSPLSSRSCLHQSMLPYMPRMHPDLAGFGTAHRVLKNNGDAVVLLLQRERRPAIREGPAYQANVPAGPPRLPRPSGREEDDPRAGVPGPTPLEALALAAGPEKDSADALPLDARADPALGPNGAHAQFMQRTPSSGKYILKRVLTRPNVVLL